MNSTLTSKKGTYNYEVRGHKVCRATFLSLYGISEYTWKRFCGAVKSKGSANVNSASVTTWGDDHVHDISYNDMKGIYEDNLHETPGACMMGKYVVVYINYRNFQL